MRDMFVRTSLCVKSPLVALPCIPPRRHSNTHTHAHIPIVKARANQGRVLDSHAAVGQAFQSALDGVVGEHRVPEHDHTGTNEDRQQEEGGGKAEHGLVVWRCRCWCAGLTRPVLIAWVEGGERG